MSFSREKRKSKSGMQSYRWANFILFSKVRQGSISVSLVLHFQYWQRVVWNNIISSWIWRRASNRIYRPSVPMSVQAHVLQSTFLPFHQRRMALLILLMLFLVLCVLCNLGHVIRLSVILFFGGKKIGWKYLFYPNQLFGMRATKDPTRLIEICKWFIEELFL